MNQSPPSNLRHPIIVIAGPTASGKSALALELAERYDGEIICADSRTVYRGMDIGTAKPTKEDRARVPHHLLDIVNPDQRFTAADFQRLAREAITDIWRRGKVPFVVGGTGLYIEGLLLDYQYAEADLQSRKNLEAMTVAELQAMLKSRRISLPHNHDNKRHLIRSLERNGAHMERGKNALPLDNVVAIATEKAELDVRIRARADDMFSAPIIDEANALMAAYGWGHESMSGNIYPLVRQVIEGSMTIDEAKEQFVIKDRQLAKRQVTWLKRLPFVQWMGIDEARTYFVSVLE